jgi:hypothetical protein
MLYSISNKEYDICFNPTNRAINIGIVNLNINKYLYKNDDITLWKWTDIIALDTTFIGSVSLYLRTSESYDIIQIKQDINTGNAIILQITGMCPTQTPTPTNTPSKSATPTITPTNTATPSQTVTNTPSSTLSLNKFICYISNDLELLCYNRYSDYVKAITVYDSDDVLQLKSNIYKNSTGSIKWYYSEITTSLSIPATIPRVYVLESSTGIVYSIISGTGGFAVVESEQVLCPPMKISNSRYNLCHTNSYQSIQVNTTNLTIKNYLYKVDGIAKWTWSELIGLNSSFFQTTTLYLKRDNPSTTTIAVKEDIATGYVLIVSVDVGCPTQTPTPTSTPTITPTPQPTQKYGNDAYIKRVRVYDEGKNPYQLYSFNDFDDINENLINEEIEMYVRFTNDIKIQLFMNINMFDSLQEFLESKKDEIILEFRRKNNYDNPIMDFEPQSTQQTQQTSQPKKEQNFDYAFTTNRNQLPFDDVFKKVKEILIEDQKQKTSKQKKSKPVKQQPTIPQQEKITLNQAKTEINALKLIAKFDDEAKQRIAYLKKMFKL